MIRAAWIVAALLTLGRAAVAFTLPLTGDEAYYWEWSKRLAFGYVDHPPAVAWTIGLFAPLGHEAGVVRLGFVLCGAVATLALAACAALLAGDKRAGAAAALAFSLAPLFSVAFTVATPDGPYLAFWCCALYLAARLQLRGGLPTALLLGVALGGVLLSRLFGFALVAGLCAFAATSDGRALWRRGFALSLAAAALVYSPFLVWNAQHGWVTFAFALLHRHEGEGGAGVSLGRLLAFCGAQALAYSPGIWLAALACALRPRVSLVAWTAVPLLAFLTAFVAFRQVEVNWTLGAVASLCVLIGAAFVRLTPPARRSWTALSVAPAAALLCAAFTAALWPATTYAAVTRTTGVSLRNNGPFEIYAFRPLAQDLSQLVSTRNAVVVTDGYGFSSVLDFEAALPPVVIGYDWQGRESRAWYPSTMHPQRALFVDKEPLSTRPDFQAHLARACAHTFAGGTRAYRFGSAPPRTFYLTWCEGLRPQGLAILRWEREPT
jgi:4-amino-4-deoxy-L-arabinose transferase-like glycosyltransferase